MAFILLSSGFQNFESLQEFCNRFPNISNCLDEDLEKIWICHKYSEDIPIFEKINSLPGEDYFCLSKKVKRKIVAEKAFYSLPTEFSAFSIFNKIYCHFDKQLATYLFTKCYVFYNWGINALEPVIDHFEIHTKIVQSQKNLFRTHKKKIRCNFFNDEFLKKIEISNGARCERGKSVDLFEESHNLPKKHTKLKVVSFKSVAQASAKAIKFFEYSKNPKNPYQEMFTLNKILYDMKQRTRWSKNSIFSMNDIEDIILFIIKIPVTASNCIENKLLMEQKKWVTLKKILTNFIENHKNLSRNNGYRRILEFHLKNDKVKTDSGTRLHPLPKKKVCTYILDILRRVLPFGLFEWFKLRKQFFSELLKVIKGNKNETFIWYPLLRPLLIRKPVLRWFAQINDYYIQSLIILKVFKFIILHYVFIILRNNFYITETGSSGFGLRYYRKSDMESTSSIYLNNFLRNGHIRRLKKNDYDVPSVERNWLNSGVITEEDLRRKLKIKMSPDSEYKQPIARVRFLPKSENSDELRNITYFVKKELKNIDSISASKRLRKFFIKRESQRKKNIFFVKLFLEFLVDKVGFGIRPLPSNLKLEAAWKKAVYLKEKYGTLFFVKADISDAFNSVKYNVLTEILRGVIEKEMERGNVQLKKIIEWKKTSRKIQKVVRFSFSERPKENSVMLHRSFFVKYNKKIEEHFSLKFLKIIKQMVMQQKVEINGKIYKLNKGLAQGSAGRFSPQLCEIYYSSMDNSYFAEFINSSDSILLRAVDDYLLITSDLKKAVKFLGLVQRGIAEYNVTFNERKLKSNLIDNIQEITYLGLVFNFESMSVKPNYSKYYGGDLLSTINLYDKWGINHFNKELFLQRRLLRVKCLKLHSIVINRMFNNLKAVRRTVFEACRVQSLRVMSLADYLYPGKKKDEFAIYRVLLMSCSYIRNLVVPRGFSSDEFSWIFFFAALKTLQKFSGQFKLLFKIVQFKLQQCEKVFVGNGAETLINFLKDDILEKPISEGS